MIIEIGRRSGQSVRWQWRILTVLGIAVAVAGCGPAASKPAARKKKSPPPAVAPAADPSPAAPSSRPQGKPNVSSPERESVANGADAPRPATDEKPSRPRLPPGFGPAHMPAGPRTLADLIASDPDAAAVPGAAASRSGDAGDLLIDDNQAAAAGIRKLAGKHLALYTDILPSPEVDDLTAAFDAAVPLWCQYFEIPVERAAEWHLTGFLMHDKNRFVGAGMLPADLPPFPHGYQRGNCLWVYDQPDGYYRRHLVLHEGTHAFMAHFLGAIGPPWYAEGMAELLGTHRWQDGQLTLGYLPPSKAETPGWGRIKIIKDEAAAGRGLMPAAIMDFGPTDHQRVEPYGWCWGLATFLDAHPRCHNAFRQLPGMVCKPELTAWFRDQLRAEWPDLNEQWQLFVMNLDYGYDVSREAIVRKDVQPLPPDGGTATIAADRGWQSTGFRLEAGTTYRLIATGRYQVGRSTDVWWCEPGGITLHYHQGQPLGLLLGAVRDDRQPPAGLTPLARPETVGLETSLTARAAGTLYLRVNDSAAGLGDNAGSLEIRIVPVRS